MQVKNIQYIWNCFPPSNSPKRGAGPQEILLRDYLQQDIDLKYIESEGLRLYRKWLGLHWEALGLLTVTIASEFL